MKPTQLGNSLFAAGLLTLLAAGCDGEPAADAGVEDAGSLDAGRDASVATCAADRDCDDGLFCNGEETCDPAGAGAGADGCVPGTAPCAAAACEESTGTCSCGEDSDMDNDGIDSIACGGTDCDDDDPNRYPGNEEVCDAEGHDEDCDPSTVGDRDGDSDGFIDAACCNGDVCGADCDDGDINVNPGASEACDGLDNNCSGFVDDGADGTLCPGGMCIAGRCNFVGWDRTWGGSAFDFGLDVAVDSSGNVYVAGSFADSVVFGTTTEVSAGGTDAFVLSFSPDGVYRWHRVYGGVGRDSANAVAIGSSGAILISGAMAGAVDFGGPTSPPGSGFLLALDSSGNYMWHRPLPVEVRRISTGVSGVVTLSSFNSGTVDLGCGPQAGPASPSRSYSLVARFDSSGMCQWSATLQVGGVSDISAAPGGITAVGTSTRDIEIGGTVYPSMGSRDLYLVGLDPLTGTLVWHRVYSASGDVQAEAVVLDNAGNSYLAGWFSGAFSLGSGRDANSGTDLREGYLLSLDGSGDYRWHRFFDARAEDSSGPTGASSRLQRIALLPGGNLGTVGVFGGTFGATQASLNLGGGLRSTTGGTAVFVAEYDDSGVYLDDYLFRTGQSPSIEGLATGPGGMTVWAGSFLGMADFGSGSRLSEGGFDAFVVRVGR